MKVKKSFTLEQKDVDTLEGLAEIDNSTASYILRKIIKAGRLFIAAKINILNVETVRELIRLWYIKKEK
jgi:hypothetical protein